MMLKINLGVTLTGSYIIENSSYRLDIMKEIDTNTEGIKNKYLVYIYETNEDTKQLIYTVDADKYSYDELLFDIRSKTLVELLGYTQCRRILI